MGTAQDSGARRKLRRKRIQKYGPTSETLSSLQLELLEQEPGVTGEEVEAEARRNPLSPTEQEGQRRRHPGRQRLPENLPRVEQVIQCPETKCADCGLETSVIGHDECEVLDVESARYFVRVVKREKRVCRCCQHASVMMPPAPPRIVEKGLASDRIVVETVVAKYCDHRVPRTWRQRCRCGAVREMKGGPSKPEIRFRLQTTASCCR